MNSETRARGLGDSDSHSSATSFPPRTRGDRVLERKRFDLLSAPAVHGTAGSPDFEARPALEGNGEPDARTIDAQNRIIQTIFHKRESPHSAERNLDPFALRHVVHPQAKRRQRLVLGAVPVQFVDPTRVRPGQVRVPLAFRFD